MLRRRRSTADLSALAVRSARRNGWPWRRAAQRARGPGLGARAPVASSRRSTSRPGAARSWQRLARRGRERHCEQLRTRRSALFPILSSPRVSLCIRSSLERATELRRPAFHSAVRVAIVACASVMRCRRRNDVFTLLRNRSFITFHQKSELDNLTGFVFFRILKCDNRSNAHISYHSSGHQPTINLARATTRDASREVGRSKGKGRPPTLSPPFLLASEKSRYTNQKIEEPKNSKNS